MLLNLTNTFADGHTQPIMLNTDSIREIEPDNREAVPSKAIIYMNAGRKYWVQESMEQISHQMNKGK